jgi:type I restriction enzyme M protein
VADIVANDWDLSINRYKEVVYEEVTYTAPATIIAEIKELNTERDTALQTLEGLLK